MSLTNKQFEIIQRNYEKTREANRHELENRIRTVYSRIPEYEALDNSVGSFAVEKYRLSTEGNEKALSELHQEIKAITSKKLKLLTDAGFPADYLDPIYKCKDCKDTGYTINDDYTKSKCHCLRKQEIEILYDQSNIRNSLKEDNFDSLSYDYYKDEELIRFQKTVDICRKFVDSFDRDYNNLFFYGTVGTGKSFLSSCVAGEILKAGHSVLYFSSIRLFEDLALYSFNNNEKKGLYDFHHDLYNCELVIIDDLGTEVTNSFVSSQLFSLLNERHLRKKATIISTNLSLEALRDRYSERVFSRITSNYSMCKLVGPDIRLIKKRMNK